MLVVGWLAILICLWTSGDLVIDLVFEEPDMVADNNVTTEEPDNAAEHLLMPSQRADSSTEDTITAAPVADLAAYFIALTAAGNATQRAAPSHHSPPRNRPISFSVPLRI
jgi:hypothetical protein